MIFSNKNKKGFTLIELLVVIAVIGMLSSIVLVSLGPARKKARDAKRQSDIRQISLAMEMCVDDPTCGNGSYYVIAADSTTPVRLTTIGIPTMNPFPTDPGGGSTSSLCSTDDGVEMSAGNYCGYTSPLGGEYCIYAKLSTGDWFVASEKGAQTRSSYPTSMSLCP